MRIGAIRTFNEAYGDKKYGFKPDPAARKRALDNQKKVIDDLQKQFDEAEDADQDTELLEKQLKLAKSLYHTMAAYINQIKV